MFQLPYGHIAPTPYLKDPTRTNYIRGAMLLIKSIPGLIDQRRRRCRHCRKRKSRFSRTNFSPSCYIHLVLRFVCHPSSSSSSSRRRVLQCTIQTLCMARLGGEGGCCSHAHQDCHNSTVEGESLWVVSGSLRKWSIDDPCIPYATLYNVMGLKRSRGKKFPFYYLIHNLFFYII